MLGFQNVDPTCDPVQDEGQDGGGGVVDVVRPTAFLSSHLPPRESAHWSAADDLGAQRVSPLSLGRAPYPPHPPADARRSVG